MASIFTMRSTGLNSLSLKHLLFIYFLITIHFAFGQSSLDSLKAIISKDTQDTVMVDALNLMSQSLYNRKSDSSIVYARQAESLSLRLDYQKGLAYSYHNIGANLFYKGELDSTILYYEKSLNIKVEIRDSISIPGTLNNIGSLYLKKGHYTKSLDFLQKALKLKLKKGDSLSASNTLNNIGNLYNHLENYDLALDYFEQSYEIRKKNNDVARITSSLNNIGLAYYYLEQYTEALIHLQEAYYMLDSMELRCRKVYTAINIGLCHKMFKDTSVAINYFNEALALAEECDDPHSKVITLLNIGKVQRRDSQNQEVLDMFMQSYDIAQSHSFNEQIQEASEQLYKEHKRRNNLMEALKYMEISTKLKDELFSEDISKQLTKMELNYQFEQERDSLEFQKKSELLAMNVKLQKQRQFQYLTAVGLVIAIGFSFMIFRNYRLKRQSNAVLTKKNELQEENLKVQESLRKQLELENNQKARSLTTTSMQLLHVNEKLTDLINYVSDNGVIENSVQNDLVRRLTNVLNSDSQWDNLKLHFESVHPYFFDRLELNYPGLSANDHKLLAFLKMKLSNKDIATILNVTTRAIEQAKRRLKKKIEMDTDELDIIQFINRNIAETPPL